MNNVQWIRPSLLWNEQTFTDKKQLAPELVKMQGDDFLPTFIKKMTPPDPRDENAMFPDAYLSEVVVDSDKLKLYQPFHDCYYLVLASLICRVSGVPDKRVLRKNGETATFVMRRIRDDDGLPTTSDDSQRVESAWTEEGWVELKPHLRDTVLPEEEQFPLLPIKTCDGRTDRMTGQPCQRTLLYGLVPAGNRGKYIAAPDAKERLPSLERDVPPATQLKTFYDDIEADDPYAVDYRLEDFDTQVLAPWNMLFDERPILTEAQEKALARTIVVHLGDFLARALPDAWNALKQEDKLSGTGVGKRNTLLALLESLSNSLSGFTLADYLRQYAPYIDQNAERGSLEALPTLVNPSFLLSLQQREVVNAGTDEENTILVPFDIQMFINGPRKTAPDDPGLSNKVKDALSEVSDAMRYTVGATSEKDPEAKTMIELIQRFVVPRRVDRNGQPLGEDRYVIRMVYTYDPDPACPPILSAPSLDFSLAKPFDPDAPARTVRLEMPSIKPDDLRKYAKGVGIQMSNDLRKVINDVHPGMLKGDAPNDTGLPALEMICTFSIPIITLVAFIVMYIFLYLFNIIFSWLAFIRVCLPIPKS